MDVSPEGVEARGEIPELHVENGEPLAIALVVRGFRGGAAGFLLGVKALEGEDGEAVDHHAGRLGVQRRRLVLRRDAGEQEQVDLLRQVVAALVEGVDGVFVGGDVVVGGQWVAGGVLVVPQVEVGAVLVEDEGVPWIAGRWVRERRIVPAGVGLVVQVEDVCGVEHGDCFQCKPCETCCMGKVKRVLIYRLGSLGDTVVALPSLHLVARAFPGAERRLLTNFPVDVKAPPAAAVLGESGLVSGYFRYAVGTRSVLALTKLWWQLRRWRPDVLVYLGAARGIESARRDEQFFRLCGVREMVGVPLTEAMQKNLYGESVVGYAYDTTYGHSEPEAARLARNIAVLGDPRLGEAASWDLRLTDAERTAARSAIGADVLALPMIAVSVGTKVQAKDWGRENWRALLSEMATAYPAHGLLLAGAPEESEASEFAADGWRTAGGGPVANLSGKLTPRESAAALSFAKIFVGHDSGPMHLAAAVQVPCVAIFAARNLPRVWFPYGKRHRVLYTDVKCMGCGLETCIVEKKKCILSITVDEVMAAVNAMMG